MENVDVEKPLWRPCLRARGEAEHQAVLQRHGEDARGHAHARREGHLGRGRPRPERFTVLKDSFEECLRMTRVV